MILRRVFLRIGVVRSRIGVEMCSLCLAGIEVVLNGVVLTSYYDIVYKYYLYLLVEFI
jgi:hypothetical protein